MFKKKKCFWCEKNKFLFLFAANNMKYSIPSDYKRRIECRLCSVKRLMCQDGKVVKFNHSTKKFHLVHIKPTLINLIKEYFK